VSDDVLWPGDVLTGASGAQYEIGRLIGVEDDDSPCDAEFPSVMQMPDGTTICRCVVCPRCGHHTGNSHQGHYWGYCQVTRTVREFHLCCPGDCELEAKL
jgi:hypothetical protein